MKPYYEAYDERYKVIHASGYAWASEEATPIVMETIRKYHIPAGAPMLEIGCGEGRDAKRLLENGYDLLATDVSPEAIAYCRKNCPAFAPRFQVADCLKSGDDRRFSFIYAVAVIHMLVPDGDRALFYRSVRERLSEDGIALICTMGDGACETQTDVRDAFALQKRRHASGNVQVAATSCRMVSFPHFESELSANGLRILEKGITSREPDFNSLMYAVAGRA